MTQRLKEAIEALHLVEALPEDTQVTIAEQVLDILEQADQLPERVRAFRSPFGGRAYSEAERKTAATAWDAMKKPSLEGLSIRELINEGRRY